MRGVLFDAGGVLTLDHGVTLNRAGPPAPGVIVSLPDLPPLISRGDKDTPL